MTGTRVHEPSPAPGPGGASHLRAAGATAGRFAGRHVLSMAQYDRDDLDVLFAAADEAGEVLASGRENRSLAGRVLVSAFFERSTRTRLAHEAAMHRLGGGVIGFADPSVTRAGGDTKESTEDIAHMLASYGDVVVVRHPTTGWPEHLASAAAGALYINGGDGVGEHPTQAMVDLYTLRQRFGKVDGLRLLVLNDLRMRCVHSLLLGLRNFDCTVYGVPAGDLADQADRGLPAIPGAPPVMLGDSVADLLPEVDVVYSSPTVAAPPTSARPDTERLRDVAVDRRLLEARAGEHLAVLHPLPRKSEVSTDIDGTHFNGYWAQAANGVPVRMALLRLLLDAH